MDISLLARPPASLFPSASSVAPATGPRPNTTPPRQGRWIVGPVFRHPYRGAGVWGVGSP